MLISILQPEIFIYFIETTIILSKRIIVNLINLESYLQFIMNLLKWSFSDISENNSNFGDNYIGEAPHVESDSDNEIYVPDYHDWYGYTGIEGITTDINGVLYYITGYCYSEVHKFDPAKPNNKPELLIYQSNAGFSGIIYNGKDTLYLSSTKNHQILAYSIQHKELSVIAGKGEYGHSDGNLLEATFSNSQRNGDRSRWVFNCCRSNCHLKDKSSERNS
jgi:hypothetical protein